MKKIDFDNDSIKKNILQAALPMLAAQILSLLYNIVDRIYIARIPDMGTTALGAVGLCFPIIMLTIAFSNLFGSGGAPLFSIKRGMSDDRAANTIMNTSFTMVCTFAVVFTALCMIFAKPLLIVFGASENALKYALPYLLIYLIGTLPSMISTGMNPFINAQGYSTTGMLSVAIGAVANLVLDPLFIFGFNFGIKGAAIATVISQILSALYVLHFLRKKAELKVRLMTLSEFSENTRYAKDIISLGTSGCVMQLTNSLVSICCNNVLSVTGGDLYISVMTIVSSIRQMVETPIYAIVEGSSPVLSYNYGAKRPAGTVAEYGDTGVGQKAAIKKGVASLQEVEVPSPCRLMPYRTFTEVAQPMSNFIFRVKDNDRYGVTCALFEADGGAWKNEAKANIKAYLEKELADVSNIFVIS